MRKIILFCLVIVLSGVLQAQDQAQSIQGFTSLVGLRNIVVGPVDRSQTSMLIVGGAIDTDGYTNLVVNIAGEIEASNSKAGILGAVLIPDVAPYDYAFKTLGLLPASLEVTTPIEIGQKYFISKQVKFDIGFPRYRVVFYNTSDATARLSFFGYRTKN
jgi:hypothetical protein